MHLTLRKRRIHYFRQGTGAPVVLIHGWGGSGKSLMPLAQILQSRHDTTVIDLPGFGESDLPDKEWGVEEYAAIVEEAIRTLGLNRPVFFGHSFGGSIGIYLAATHKNIFSKLVLCDASFKRSPAKSSFIGAVLRKLPVPSGLMLAVRKTAYRILYPGSDSLRYPHLESNFRKIVSTDLTPLTPDITVPTLILWGENDRDTPLAYAKLLEKNIPGSRLTVFPGQTHGLPLHQPREVASVMGSFL
jgi:pimeloyl-ACP methyl ester carboxylesterase